MINRSRNVLHDFKCARIYTLNGNLMTIAVFVHSLSLFIPRINIYQIICFLPKSGFTRSTTGFQKTRLEKISWTKKNQIRQFLISRHVLQMRDPCSFFLCMPLWFYAPKELKDHKLQMSISKMRTYVGNFKL